MTKYKLILIALLTITCFKTDILQAQELEGEPVLYFQMEPFDDSLFIKIQSEVFIDPPDPKAEIIADLRDANNQTLSIKGTLYPFLAFSPETRARIQTFPFKINLSESINFGSVFTRVIERIRFSKIVSPPTLYQISSTLQYINPFLQFQGGERFGIPLKQDIGISLGLGTPYSGIVESNFIEFNFHILGAYGGIFNGFDGITTIRKKNSHNNLYTTLGYHFGYVLPFGNFFEVSFAGMIDEATESEVKRFSENDTEKYKAKILSGSYFNWEFRYPFSFLGSTRAKVYCANYLNEFHIGFTGRELSLAGSTFDFRFDAMPSSDVRQPQYVLEFLVQKIAEGWGFSSVSLGPSLIFSKNTSGNPSIISFLINLRLKVGTSL
ncbi:MAG: hypothetical protein HXY50_14325 [Ignavibacteriaceae bacterium]|nr:hypothetical protein [Ignavibacteriaceae bacterium]